MRLFMRALGLCFGLLTTEVILAAEAGRLTTINTGESSLTTVAPPQDVARVRIPIRLTNFEGVIIQNERGVKRMEYKKLAPISYTLRATINRSNHFYLADWHIETLPSQWSREARQWQVELKLYKRYGQDHDLEEYVGTFPLKGQLSGEERLFTLKTSAKQEYKSKNGSPALIIEAGAFAEEKGNIARSQVKP